MVTEKNSRYLLLGMFSLVLVSTQIYMLIIGGNYQFHTSIGKNGHLMWEWLHAKNIVENILLISFLLLYIIPALLIDNKILTGFVIVSLFVSLFFYYKYNTWGSMWCWLSNSFLLYCIIDILLIKPFYEYNGLC